MDILTEKKDTSSYLWHDKPNTLGYRTHVSFEIESDGLDFILDSKFYTYLWFLTLKWMHSLSTHVHCKLNIITHEPHKLQCCTTECYVSYVVITVTVT